MQILLLIKMKTSKSLLSVSVIFLLTSFMSLVLGQGTKKTIQIKIIEDGKTTVDTSFKAGDLDKDQLHKKIEGITGEKIDVESIDTETEEIHKHGPEDKMGHHKVTKKVMIVKEENDGTSSSKKMEHYDGVKKGMNHSEKRVDIEVSGDDALYYNGGKIHRMHPDEKGDFFWVERSDDQKKEKKPEVRVLVDKEHVSDDSKTGNVKVIVINEKDGTIIDKDNVKVIEMGEDEGNVEVIVRVGEKKDIKSSKETKETKETKQKKHSKRKQK